MGSGTDRKRLRGLGQSDSSETDKGWSWGRRQGLQTGARRDVRQEQRGASGGWGRKATYFTYFSHWLLPFLESRL